MGLDNFNRGYALTSLKSLKLKPVGLDTDPYNLPKKQWFMDIDIWLVIRFPDISTSFWCQGNTQSKEGIHKPGWLVVMLLWGNQRIIWLSVHKSVQIFLFYDIIWKTCPRASALIFAVLSKVMMRDARAVMLTVGLNLSPSSGQSHVVISAVIY